MKTNLECIPCLISQALKTAKLIDLEDFLKEKMLKEILYKMNELDFAESPPAIAKEIYSIINNYSNNKDPYYETKRFYNKEILKFEKEITARVEKSDDIFKEFLKLAILGNIIDFGAVKSLDRDFIIQEIANIDKKNMEKDDSAVLYKKLEESRELLYLGDNCGEIVFDKMFIKHLKKEFPKLNIYFAVRGEAIINDVLIEDVIEIGLDSFVTVIENGDSAPGTVLKNCSKDFLDVFNGVDLIISKGQGNYESLSSVKRSNIYFLLMAKCELVADNLGVEKMSLICKEN